MALGNEFENGGVSSDLVPVWEGCEVELEKGLLHAWASKEVEGTSWKAPCVCTEGREGDLGSGCGSGGRLAHLLGRMSTGGAPALRRRSSCAVSSKPVSDAAARGPKGTARELVAELCCHCFALLEVCVQGASWSPAAGEAGRQFRASLRRCGDRSSGRSPFAV